MKLASVLGLVNQFEKSKFISALDRICSDAEKDDKQLRAQVNKLDGQLKHASRDEITQLFKLVQSHFEIEIREQLAMRGGQATLLSNILSRDGNSVARLSWIEKLYDREWGVIDKRSKEVKADIDSIVDGEEYTEARRMSIYYSCYLEAYTNEERNNREAKITDEERSILNVLAKNLDISADDQVAIEHLVSPIPKNGVDDALKMLSDIGLIFISKKHNSLYVPDEVVAMLLRLQGKELANKHLVRILRTLSDPELSNVFKHRNKKFVGKERSEKIADIQRFGISVSQLLQSDMHPKDAALNERKDRLKVMMGDLDLDFEKIGSTIEERIALIIDALNNCTDSEFEALSAAGFKAMFSSMQSHFPALEKRLKEEYQLEPNEELDVEKMRSLSITPHDILFLLSNDEVKAVSKSMEINKRGNPRLNILDNFADATEKLIENYAALASRDLAELKAHGIDISEADIGIKFEEVTKAIFEHLGLTVDEDLRREINTAKDKADILVTLNEGDVIIGEAKTSKNGDFAKYSATSRQVKAYVARCENAGKRVSQVLIVAPSFSKDFIESAEMDTEVNISLLEASGLKTILDAFEARRNPKFSPKLLTKGGLLKADLIARNI